MSSGILVNIPGPPGLPGAAGAAGADGKNAYSSLTESLTMPAVNGTAVATVENTEWMVPTSNIGEEGAIGGQVVIVEFLGKFMVSEIVDATHAVLHNIGGAYNAPAGTIAPSGSKVSVGA